MVGRPSLSRRRLIDGIRWRVRTGAPWRDLPAEYGPWQAVCGLFRRWQRGGAWAVVLTGLQARADAAGLITWDVNVDSTICRAHQHAAGARRDGRAQKESPGGHRAEPDDHGLGRSRGGWATRNHLACEQRQKPLTVLVTAGQRGDSPQFTAVLEAIRVPRLGVGRPRVRTLRVRVRGDKAYSSRANRAYLRRRGIRCTIPEPADQAGHRKRRGRSGERPPAFDREERTRHAALWPHLTAWADHSLIASNCANQRDGQHHKAPLSDEEQQMWTERAQAAQQRGELDRTESWYAAGGQPITLAHLVEDDDGTVVALRGDPDTDRVPHPRSRRGSRVPGRGRRPSCPRTAPPCCAPARARPWTPHRPHRHPVPARPPATARSCRQISLRLASPRLGAEGEGGRADVPAVVGAR